MILVDKKYENDQPLLKNILTKCKLVVKYISIYFEVQYEYIFKF